MNNTNGKLWGKCWGDPDNPVQLVIKWGGQQVFDGPVPTSGNIPNPRQTSEHEDLCTWPIANLVSGLVPVEITVHGGYASINNLMFNNVSPGRYVRRKPDANGKIDWPITVQEVNVLPLTDDEFFEFFRFLPNAMPDFLEYVDVPASETWVDGNFHRRKKNGIYTDGKMNVKRNGVNWPADPPYTSPFKRNYFIKNGDTLSFDYLVEWNLT